MTAASEKISEGRISELRKRFVPVTTQCVSDEASRKAADIVSLCTELLSLRAELEEMREALKAALPFVEQNNDFGSVDKRAVLAIIHASLNRLRALPREQAVGENERALIVRDLHHAMRTGYIRPMLLSDAIAALSPQAALSTDTSADTSRERGEVIPCSRGDLTADDLEELVDKLCKPHGYEPSSDDLYRTQVALLYLSIRMRSAPAAAPVEMERDARHTSCNVGSHTLVVTHVFDGEEVVTGGEDGQAWVATFADPIEAKAYVRFRQDWSWMVGAQRKRIDAAIAAAGEGA